MKTILVIGAGEFGRHLAMQMFSLGNEVMLVDRQEKIINEISKEVTTCEIGDYTIKSNLEALGVDDYDYIFVCVGDFKSSLVIVDTLKSIGAGFIIAKASNEIHERFLIMSGADRVVYPERDIAFNMAVEYSNSNVFDFVPLSGETGIYEIKTPQNWVGKSLRDVNVRKNHGVTVIASKYANSVTAITDADYVFTPSEHIFVIGAEKDIKRITKN